MKKLALITTVFALMMALASPAMAAGADGAGREFGAHHASHAKDMGGFSAEMNPGVMHTGFAGWDM